MSGLHLKLRRSPPVDCDAAALGGELRGLSVEQVGGLQLPCLGSHCSLPVRECFDVKPRVDDRVVIEGDLERFHRLGARWSAGQLMVEGNVGDAFVSQMVAGQVTLRGNAGDGVAEQMRGGELTVSGNVGDGVGRPLPGRRSGMSGGAVIVAGNARHTAGYRMRRGMLVIRGDCGDSLGCDMVAGTIVVGGSAGSGVAAGMRRGTVIVPDSVELSAMRFTPARVEELSIVRLLVNGLPPVASRLADALKGSIRRSLGDVTAGGMGEVWLYRS
jgi:formylmethanofuran dehydrogenase subunit C